jgi:hypothetical protein
VLPPLLIVLTRTVRVDGLTLFLEGLSDWAGVPKFQSLPGLAACGVLMRSTVLLVRLVGDRAAIDLPGDTLAPVPKLGSFCWRGGSDKTSTLPAVICD